MTSSVKLAALVGSLLGERISPEAPTPLPIGAALRLGSKVWVIYEKKVNGQASSRCLGPALGWAWQASPVEELNLIVGPHAQLFANQAEAFAQRPRVWKLDGKEIHLVAPQPFGALPKLDPVIASYAELFSRAGARPIVEQDMLIAEVEGLEVARAHYVQGEPTVSIGVGRLDREAHDLIRQDRSTESVLAEVVQLVRRHRYPNATSSHPLTRLARERFARSIVIDNPGVVGARSLEPLAAMRTAPDLIAPWPAVASGVDEDGQPLVVVCSVGVDLDLIPVAGEARLRDGRQARLVVVVPKRDLHTLTVKLARLLSEPAELVGLDLGV